MDWQSYAGTWTWTISPKMVNNLTGSYTRMYDTSNSGINPSKRRKRDLLLAIHHRRRPAPYARLLD